MAAVSLLSPLLVSCMDDDWNADVRSVAVGVVRQLFLDLHVSLLSFDLNRSSRLPPFLHC